MVNSLKLSDNLETNLNALFQLHPEVEINRSRMINWPCLIVNPEKLYEIMELISNWQDTPMNYFNCITAVDKLTHLEVIYYITSIPSGDQISVVSMCPRQNASLPSVVNLWRSADFQEREVFEFFGIKFENHPDLRRLITPEQYKGFPLLKDYPKAGDPDDLKAVDAILPENSINNAQAEKDRLREWLNNEIKKRV